MAGSRIFWQTSALAAVLQAATPAQARSDDLVRLINAYRAAPASCNGQRMPVAAPLARSAALARIRISPGTILVAALENQGYAAEHVEAISISGPEDAQGALTAALGNYCASLRAARFQHVGVARRGNAWDIILADPAPPRPPPPPPLAPQVDTARALVAAVNQARAKPRSCGATQHEAAGPLTLNYELNEAALVHSRDMALNNYFSHDSKDGTRVSERARSAGYAWLYVGENIAYGQRSVEEVLDSWLESPGHCANIMSPLFTEMGAGYAYSSSTKRPYWTQVLGKPRN